MWRRGKTKGMTKIDPITFFEIQRVIEDWVVFRDAGQFDLLLSLWHEGGRMMTTWSQVPAVDFVRMTREAFARGIKVHHSLGGCHIDVAGDRAIGQTKVKIAQRGDIDGITCDAVCTGRFYDFFERREGVWKIVLRHPIYEVDRIDSVEPNAPLKLDPELLASFPEGYRHLAYLQTKLGMTVKRDMPGLQGPEVDALYASGSAWLRGEDAII